MKEDLFPGGVDVDKMTVIVNLVISLDQFSVGDCDVQAG